jgi:amidase
MVQHWREIVSKKRAETEKQLPEEWRLPTSILNTINPKSETSVLDVPAKCGLLSSKELEITEKYDAVDLIQEMSCKELSSLKVITAFCKRAAIAHQVVSNPTGTQLASQGY